MIITITVDNGTVGKEACDSLVNLMPTIAMFGDEDTNSITLHLKDASEQEAKNLLDWYLENQDIGLDFLINSMEQ